MRIVLCDADALLRELVESMVTRAGHEIMGIADSTAGGVHLVEMARPDVVIVDVALGFNSDYNVIRTANELGATVIVFSLVGHDVQLSDYSPPPILADKPDLAALEHALVRAEQLRRSADPDGPDGGDRRQRPVRAASGPLPTGVADAQAFYEALNDAVEGDALVSIQVAGDGLRLGEDVSKVTRDTDRLLASPTSVKAFLLGGGAEAIQSFLGRVGDLAILTADAQIRSIVVEAGEAPTDAFDRLREGTEHPVP